MKFRPSPETESVTFVSAEFAKQLCCHGFRLVTDENGCDVGVHVSRANVGVFFPIGFYVVY